MELLANLGLGFETALSPWNLVYCFIGVLLGTAVGVLPGLGPVPTIAMLLPLTFGLPPVSALIMLAGIYYGAQYGGSTTAILINLPGESSSVVTAIDGYQMAKKGRAGPALATAALGSFFAGSVATVLLAVAAPPLADVALEFGPAEYFSLMVLGLVASVALHRGSVPPPGLELWRLTIPTPQVFYWSHLSYLAMWLLLILHGPNFWKWLLVPGILFFLEKAFGLTVSRMAALSIV